MGRKPTKKRRYAVTPEGARLLNRARKERKLSYASLAKTLRTTQSAVHGLLNEKLKTCNYLPQLCELLGVPLLKTLPIEEHTLDIMQLVEELYDLSPKEADLLRHDIEMRIEALKARKSRGNR